MALSRSDCVKKRRVLIRPVVTGYRQEAQVSAQNNAWLQEECLLTPHVVVVVKSRLDYDSNAGLNEAKKKERKKELPGCLLSTMENKHSIETVSTKHSVL